jgi:cytochrome c5
MKQTRQKPLLKLALWLSTTLCCAVVAFSAGQFPQEAPGEKIVNTACVACHELRPIETQALDKEGWAKVVSAMVDKGATVKADDVPVLVNYLAAAYGPLPDGAGKPILLEVCTQCHTLDRVKARGASAEEWDELLMHMLNEGAPLSDSQYPVLLNYLARNFRP